jgi:hypothetical protein
MVFAFSLMKWRWWSIRLRAPPEIVRAAALGHQRKYYLKIDDRRLPGP